MQQSDIKSLHILFKKSHKRDKLDKTWTNIIKVCCNISIKNIIFFELF